jgi:hypothetical protein
MLSATVAIRSGVLNFLVLVDTGISSRIEYAVLSCFIYSSLSLNSVMGSVQRHVAESSVRDNWRARGRSQADVSPLTGDKIFVCQLIHFAGFGYPIVSLSHL